MITNVSCDINNLTWHNFISATNTPAPIYLNPTNTLAIFNIRVSTEPIF